MEEVHSGAGLVKRLLQSSQIRRRALNALRERLMPLKRVEPRINSSLGEEFIRFFARISSSLSSLISLSCLHVRANQRTYDEQRERGTRSVSSLLILTPKQSHKFTA